MTDRCAQLEATTLNHSGLLATATEALCRAEEKARQLTVENEQKYKEYRRSLDEVTRRKDREVTVSFQRFR